MKDQMTIEPALCPLTTDMAFVHYPIRQWAFKEPILTPEELAQKVHRWASAIGRPQLTHDLAGSIISEGNWSYRLPTHEFCDNLVYPQGYLKGMVPPLYGSEPIKDGYRLAREIRFRHLTPYATDGILAQGQNWFVWDGSQWASFCGEDFLAWLSHEIREVILNDVEWLWRKKFYNSDGSLDEPAYRAAYDEHQHNIKMPAVSITLVNSTKIALRKFVSLPLEAPRGWVIPVHGDTGPGVPFLNGYYGMRYEPYPLDGLFWGPVIPHVYREAAPPTVLLNMLHSSGVSDRHIKIYQRFGGYAMACGIEGVHKFLNIMGPSRSGKGVLSEVLTFLLGEGNCSSKKFSSFHKEFATADLVDKLLVIFPDERFDGSRSEKSKITSTLISMVANDRLPIESKGQDSYTQRIMARVVIVSNDIPVLDDGYGALANRLLVVKTNKGFPTIKDGQDPDLYRKIIEQKDELVNWFYEGFYSLALDGFDFGETSEDKEAFVITNDPVDSFLKDNCVPEGQILKDDLMNAFNDWCEDKGFDYIDKAVFTKHLLRIHPHVKPSRSKVDNRSYHYYKGISLKQ